MSSSPAPSDRDAHAAAHTAPRREDNPRLVDRQTWWIEYGQWMSGRTSGPICTECADPMPDAPFVGAFVCDECAPFVPESERGF